MPKPLSRKFVSPAFSGEKVSDENGERKENSSRKKEKAIPKSLSNSQYEEIFSGVIKKSGCSSEDSYADDDSVVEDYVAIPEPNAALSPHEKAEEMNRDVINHGSMTITETPRNPIDNSNLPPLKKKKPESRIKKLGLKLKPTRLNFDDPELRGKPEKMLKPLETDTLTKSTSKKHTMSNITTNTEKLENTKSLPDKETSKQKAIPSKKKGENEETFLKPFVSRKFQSHQAATGKGEEQRKMSSHDPVIPSSNLSSVSNFGSLSLPQSTPKTFQFGSQESCSPESKILSPRSRLLRLQTKRNVGLWVQCSKRVCSKWRYLANTSDPSEVPDKWQCCMNDDDKYASCEAPECGPTPLEEEDLIHNIYNAGSLVWAHLAGFPWWPAMVDDDPDVEQYYWITEYCDIPTHYNVTFFDEKSVTRAWLTPGALTKYVDNEKRKDFQKMSANGIDYSQRIKVAIEQANEAAKLSIMERLKKFSFVARYNGPIGKKRQLLDTPELGRKKAKKSKREEKRTKTDSLADSQASIQRSLEVVKEVNEVLSQITSDSESDGSEEDPQIDLNKSLEEVNEVMNLLSDCESLDVDDDQLEEYLKSSQKESSVIQEEKSASKSKKKFTKPSVNVDKGKDKNRRTYSIKDFEKKKHGMELSSSFKETKSDSKGSSSMGNEKAERKEKSKDRRHEYKDKRENLHHLKDSMKVQSEMVQSSSPKESQQKLKRADNHKSEGHEKDKGSSKEGHGKDKGSSKEGHGKHEVSLKEGYKESSKEGHEVPRETKKKNDGPEKTKVSKQGVSDVAQKNLNSDSKKKETGSKEKKGNSNKTDTTSKKKDGKSTKDEVSRDDNRKQKKGVQIGKDKGIERSEGKTKNTKNRESGAKESPKGNPASSPVAKKGSSESLEIFQHSSDEENVPGEDRNRSVGEDAEEKDEHQVKEGLRKAEGKKKNLEEEETVEEGGEKMEEEIEGESTKEEVLGERGSEGEESVHREALEQEETGTVATMLSDGRASVDIFKEGIEEDAPSAASEDSADFDFEE